MPTILDLIGVDFTLLPGEMLLKSSRLASTVGDLRLDGFSHKAVLLGETSTGPRSAIYQYLPAYIDKPNTVPCASVRVGDMKLIRFFAQGPQGADIFTLYNLTADVAEASDLLGLSSWDEVLASDQYSNVATELKATLDNHLSTMGALIPGPSPGFYDASLAVLAAATTPLPSPSPLPYHQSAQP